MRWLRGIGIAGLLMVIVLLGVGARGTGKVAPPDATGPQEAEVMSVLIEKRTDQPLVVLRGKRDKRQLVMVIGHGEARSIAIQLDGLTPPRPLTHDLFLTLFGRLKVTLKRVVITDLRNDIFYATVYLDTNGTEITVDSRPSDAIALAIRAKVPILVEDRVFEKSDSSREHPGTSPYF
ncbi:MAG: bifunctional nuclease family protein [Candidatus Methylomirabilia bacterium]